MNLQRTSPLKNTCYSLEKGMRLNLQMTGLIREGLCVMLLMVIIHL